MTDIIFEYKELLATNKVIPKHIRKAPVAVDALYKSAR